jgi:hypothetical protein
MAGITALKACNGRVASVNYLRRHVLMFHSSECFFSCGIDSCFLLDVAAESGTCTCMYHKSHIPSMSTSCLCVKYRVRVGFTIIRFISIKTHEVASSRPYVSVWLVFCTGLEAHESFDTLAML